MKSLLLLLAALPLFAGTVFSQELTWPGFRGPQRDGVARGAEPPVVWDETENVKWKLELPGGGSSSPIILGDRIYVACYSGYGNILEDQGDPEQLTHHLVCADRATGELIWDRMVPGPIEERPPQVQLSEHGFASPTPISDGETIYAYFGRAGVVAFDLEGNVLWQTDLGTPTDDGTPTNTVAGPNGQAIPLRWGTAASPLLYENLVIVNASEESNSIQALDTDDGEVVWRVESPNLEGSAISPLLVGPSGSQVLVIGLGGEVWGLEPGTGEMLWEVETGTRGGMVPTPVADERRVYAFGGSGQSHALRFQRDSESEEGETPRVVWQSQNLDIPSPVLYDGLLFLVRTNGMAVCIAAEDGLTVFTGRLEGRTGSVYASPVVAGGRLYVVSRERGTFVYSADGKFELLARNELGDSAQFNASPAIAGEQLYLRSDKYLYCVSES